MNRKNRKLALKTTTLRPLADSELERIVGGDIGPGPGPEQMATGGGGTTCKVCDPFPK